MKELQGIEYFFELHSVETDHVTLKHTNSKLLGRKQGVNHHPSDATVQIHLHGRALQLPVPSKHRISVAKSSISVSFDHHYLICSRVCMHVRTRECSTSDKGMN